MRNAAMSRIAALLVLLLPVFACDDSPTEPGERKSVVTATVLSASYTGIDRGRNELLRDAGAWSDAWNEIHARMSPRPPLPSIDFGRDMLVLAALGERPNGCFAVEIRAVEQVGATLRVEVEEAAPGPACSCTLARVQPVHVLRLARHDGPVEFRDRRVTLPCG
jgi:hypothetical protein